MNRKIFSEYLAKLNIFLPPPCGPKSAGAVLPVSASIPPKSKNAPECVVSVLAADLSVEGSVEADSDVVVKGRIRGDVSCRGNVEVCGGCVEGNLTARSISLSHADVAGTIRAETKLKITDSKINGDLFACDAEVEGSVVGNISVDGLLVLRHSAAIRGDIVAGNVSVEKNVALEGKISIRKQGMPDSAVSGDEA